MAFSIVATGFVVTVVYVFTFIPIESVKALNIDFLPSVSYNRRKNYTYRAIVPIIKVLTIALVATRLVKAIIGISA